MTKHAIFDLLISAQAKCTTNYFQEDTMKKFLAIVLALVMIAAMGSSAFAAEPEVIKIGYIGDLTGGTSIWGQYGKYGAELAVMDYNEKGGVLNGQYKIELVPMDGKGEPADSVNAYKKLVTQDGVVASIGTNFSSCNIPMASVADELHVPIIGTAASNELVTVDESGKLHPYSFRMCFLDSYIGTAIGSYAAGNYKTAALISVLGDTNSEAVSSFIKDAFEADGGKIVAEEQCQSGDQEFRAQLAKIKKADPEVVFVIINNYAMISAFAKQAREMEITAPFIGHDGWDSQELADIAQGSLDGCYYVSRIGFSNPEAAAFGERVNEYFKLDSAAETECLFGYDGVSWIVDAIERAGSVDPTAIRDALEATDVFEGYIGTLVMNPETHNPTLACELYKFEGTERIAVQEIEAVK